MHGDRMSGNETGNDPEEISSSLASSTRATGMVFDDYDVGIVPADERRDPQERPGFSVAADVGHAPVDEPLRPFEDGKAEPLRRGIDGENPDVAAGWQGYRCSWRGAT